MSQVLDWSSARPDLDEVVRLGFVGAVRYLAPTPNRKVIDADELDALHKAGLAVAFVYEGGASNAFAGAAQGTKDGKVARRLADALGVPMSRPIYAAVDKDATVAMFDAIEEYLRAFGAETGRPVGVYGEWEVVEAMLDRGAATFAWQTVAWSRGARSKRAVLFQRAQQIFGGGADVNDVLADDWGQWAPQSAGPPAEEDDEPVLMLLKGKDSADWFVTDYLSKRYVESPAEATSLINDVTIAGGRIIYQGTPGAPQPHERPQKYVDLIPTSKAGR